MSKVLIWGTVFTLLLTMFEDEAIAGRRRRGVRRPQGRARMVRRVVRRAPVRRVVVRNNNNINRAPAVLAAPANGNANNNQNNNQIDNFGPASFNPVALGLGSQQIGVQPLSGFASIGTDRFGNFFEMNNGQVVQPIVGFNGSLVVGQNSSFLPGTEAEVRAFNQGAVPVRSFGIDNNGFRGSSQVISIRNR